MQLGLFFDLRNPAPWQRPWRDHYEATIDLAVSAEQTGCEAIWVTEHHGFDDGYLSQPLTFLAALARETTSVRLGTGVLVAPFRHPRHVAEQAALVDLLADGRLELGLGAGYAPHEFEAFDVDLADRMRRTDEVATRVRDLLWSGDLRPPPAQARLPVWLGYQGPRGARAAGRLGVGLLTTRTDLLEPYRAGREESGLPADGGAMGGLVEIVVARDPERTARALVPHVHHQRATYGAARSGRPAEPLDEASSHQIERDLLDHSAPGLTVVTTDGAVDHLDGLIATLPVEHLYLWASIAAMPAELVAEHVELTFSDVRPRLADRR